MEERRIDGSGVPGHPWPASWGLGNPPDPDRIVAPGDAVDPLEPSGYLQSVEPLDPIEPVDPMESWNAMGFGRVCGTRRASAPKRWTLFLVAGGDVVPHRWRELFADLFPEASRFSGGLIASLREDGVCVALRRHREIVESRADEVARYASLNGLAVSCRMRCDP